MNTQNTESFEFPAIWERDAKQALKKVQKAARRIDVKPPEVVKKSYTKKNGKTVARWEVELASTLRLGNFQTVAVIDHAPSENLVYWFGDEDDESQSRWRHVDPNCDHCQQNRRRHKTYIVQEGDGPQIQVGSTCIKDFTGHRDFTETLLKALSHLKKSLHFSKEPMAWENHGSGGGTFVAEPLFYILAVLEEKGPFVPSAHAGSTKESALSKQVEENFSRWDEMIENDDPLVQKAEDILEWALNIEKDYGYLANLRSVAKKHSWGMSDFGLAASMPNAYRQEKQKELEVEKVKQASSHFGEEGERYDLELTLTFVTSYESYYGEGQVIKMEDDEGNQFVWFTSSFPLLGDKDRGIKNFIDQKVKVRGTVKEHGDYKGIPQTTLTRCKIELA